MNADGSNIVQVTTAPTSAAGVIDQQPDFSPDGTKLVFVRDAVDGRDGAIYIVGVDGKGLRQVTPASLDASRPRWSPDGSKILFGNSDTASAAVGQNVHVVNVDGSGPLALTHQADPNSASAPDWSPDGKMIVFSRYHAGDNYFSLVVMHSDGSDPIVIWHPTPRTDNFPGSAAWGKAP